MTHRWLTGAVLVLNSIKNHYFDHSLIKNALENVFYPKNHHLATDKVPPDHIL